ncbi:MAG: aspartate/tyrosine/aromatic aminotransferase [Myxococcales bacterium FL481]|nr:MAG: aspartate/tyrosine/aromatic aminotransferase [Myxococcales bacterium FL481]
MFRTLTLAPPDAIFGLTEAFGRDPNPDKINLGAGVFKDEAGRTPVLAAVTAAERRLVDGERSKVYRPIVGEARYGELVRDLVFGDEPPPGLGDRCVTAHSPGGTGALRVVGECLAKLPRRPTVWVTTPTWANHRAIFSAAGLRLEALPYFDATANALDFGALLDGLNRPAPGDVVLLHGCCHNPTGVDPSPTQWQQIAERLSARELLPLVDFAYQGFGDGLQEDAQGVRMLAERLPELIVCSSFSKNFGLYNERTGAVSILAENADAAELVRSNLKVAIRSNYSNPPAHGANIVRTILDDAELASGWRAELAMMRDRIRGMRTLFVETLAAKRASLDGAAILRQRGMFSLIPGVGPAAAQSMRDKYSVYIVDSGRINVAGITPSNVERLCDALVGVL